jgi:hypothetical protein
MVIENIAICLVSYALRMFKEASYYLEDCQSVFSNIFFPVVDLDDIFEREL